MVNAWTVALTKYPKYGKISTTYIKAIVDEKREKGQRFSFKFPVIQPFTYRCLLLLGFSGRVSFSAPLSNSGWTMWLMV